ncbi:MAG: hypothetical protein HRT57_07865 [Crocinitomicaceae bacterium]|nr:hypothetical protein [Crocinitomicaceae bacterium]
MKKEMSSKEEQLYDLMESKLFDELSADEADFVLSQTSKAEYAEGHKTLVASLSLNDNLIAKPLVLPSKRNVIVVPLYQMVSAIAAAVLISFFVFRSNEIITKEVNVPSVATVDTVYIDNSTYDTVVESEIQYVDLVIYEKAQERMVERAHIQSKTNIRVPEFTLEDITTVGQSLKNDETFVLVKHLIAENQNGIFRRD